MTVSSAIPAIGAPFFMDSDLRVDDYFLKLPVAILSVKFGQRSKIAVNFFRKRIFVIWIAHEKIRLMSKSIYLEKCTQA
jgi:hypothetical protein